MQDALVRCSCASLLWAAAAGSFEMRREGTNARPCPDCGHLWIVVGRLVIEDDAARRRYLETLSDLGA